MPESSQSRNKEQKQFTETNESYKTEFNKPVDTNPGLVKPYFEQPVSGFLQAQVEAKRVLCHMKIDWRMWILARVPERKEGVFLDRTFFEVLYKFPQTVLAEFLIGLHSVFPVLIVKASNINLLSWIIQSQVLQLLLKFLLTGDSKCDVTVVISNLKDLLTPILGSWGEETRRSGSTKSVNGLKQLLHFTIPRISV